ncbi:MAG: SCO family protein [Acidobacteria bacterium]|nr:SCO family protein [Acidobacteriota bacterium]
MQRRSWLLSAIALMGCSQKSKLPELGSIPPFEFTNQEGVAFASSQLKGKVWVADFFFTNCPGPCPRMANQLKRVQQETSELKQLHLVSITVDPDRDTAAALQSYARRFGAQPERWTFLTGRKDLIKNLMSESFYLGFADSMQEHSTRFVLVDKQMKIRGFYDSFAKDSIDKLIEDIRDLHDRS